MQNFIKYLLYLVFLINCGEAQLLSGLTERILGEVESVVIGDLEILPTINQSVDADNITYNLYNSSSPDTPAELNFCGAKVLTTSTKIVFVIHGWLEDHKADWLPIVRKAFFARDSQYLVIEVNWSAYSRLEYGNSHSATTKIGPIIGEFITDVAKKYKIPLENFLIVGYSMGGHIAGYLGKKVTQVSGKKLKRIVALDPAGPEYENKPAAQRLARTDAEVVQVICTNSGQFGYDGECGTVHFRPNGGHEQPGCLEEPMENVDSVTAEALCSRRRSTLYFAEGIQASPKFLAKNCITYDNYENDQRFCDQNTEEMCNLATVRTGNFFLNTNSNSPYSE